jgi:hypothetical protein
LVTETTRSGRLRANDSNDAEEANRLLTGSDSQAGQGENVRIAVPAPKDSSFPHAARSRLSRLESGPHTEGDEDLFCECCGQSFLANESFCARCRIPPTRQWLQLFGLAALAIAALSNSFAALALFPHLALGHVSLLVRAWISFNDVVFLFGWMIVTVGLLVWSLWFRRGYDIQRKEWLARLLLFLLFTAGIVSLRPRPVSGAFASLVRTTFHTHPWMWPFITWGLIALAVVPLCLNPEMRNSLFGQGRVLSLVGLGVLSFVMLMTLVGWFVSP